MYSFQDIETGADNLKLAKWRDDSTSKDSIQLITKDIDFDSPGVRKKVYKIYVSIAGNIAPNVKVLYAINGSKNFYETNTFVGVENYSENDGFYSPYQEYSQDSNGDSWYTAILKPNTSNGESLNNIYSIQLMFVGINQFTPDDDVENHNHFVDADFQMNDLTIIYRSKNAR